MYYLSFDCANKSLAIGLYFIQPGKSGGRSLITFDSDDKNLLNDISTNHINILYLKVIDLIPNQKLKEVDLLIRSNALKKALVALNYEVLDLIKFPINVVVEYQMNINDKSKTIYNQIIYEYSNNDRYNVIIIKPIAKNTIHLSNELKYCNLIQKYKNSYTCNKVHAKLNFLYFIKNNNLSDKIKNIKKSNLDDIADTFMQVLAYVIS